MPATSAWLLASVLLGQIPAAPENNSGAQPPGAAASALADFQRDVRDYVINMAGAKPAALELVERPLLHWGNPARNGEDGAVFAWLKDGRPEVVGSVFTYRDRRRDMVLRKHAFHSLSDSPLTAEFQSRLIWSPKLAGVKFAPAPAAEPPAEDARRRLTQMRSLARQFSVTMVDLKEEKSELRLMTQPLLRYEPTAGPAVDGAIFAFAVATDPEALLLLEARKNGSDLRWEFAFARFHFVTLSAQHHGKEVWRVEPDKDMMRTVFGNDPQQREKVYYSVLAPQ
jgi:hypothetical protein